MISTKGRYALRVMIDLAEHSGKNYVPLKEIAERQEISKKYLEIIVKDLVKSKLIVGVGGKGGGYRLCRKPEEYTAGEIIEAAEGPFITVACLAEDVNECPRASCCKTLPLWAEFDKITHNFFFSKKLNDLL
ncbi:MAG: Rrf2 family transcriptional regulator [Clostridia bacterium]|nr:Rrf2 family transcriptional regulator [Clostridia bacterium]